MNSLAFLAMATPAEGADSPADAHARVVASAKAGDLAAYETLMRQYERMVLVTALRLLGNIEDAKDASQEVFLRVCTATWGKWKRPATPRGGCTG
jgi:RNA polymerase sigma-70 factor (ECF subfamily)